MHSFVNWVYCGLYMLVFCELHLYALNIFKVQIFCAAILKFAD